MVKPTEESVKFLEETTNVIEVEPESKVIFRKRAETCCGMIFVLIMLLFCASIGPFILGLSMSTFDRVNCQIIHNLGPNISSSSSTISYNGIKITSHDPKYLAETSTKCYFADDAIGSLYLSKWTVLIKDPGCLLGFILTLVLPWGLLLIFTLLCGMAVVLNRIDRQCQNFGSWFIDNCHTNCFFRGLCCIDPASINNDNNYKAFDEDNL